jgi:hypothetical protein
MSTNDHKKRVRKIGLFISGILFGISLFCPAFRLQEGNSGFLLGFVCLFFGFEHLPWYANLFYLGGLVALTLKRMFFTGFLAAVAIAVASTTLRIKEMPRNEAGNMTAVIGYGLGFYLWVASMLVLLIAAVVGSLKPREPVQTMP